jgi:hypothetical protein
MTQRSALPIHGTYTPANYPRTHRRQLSGIYVYKDKTLVSYHHPGHKKRFSMKLADWNQWVRTAGAVCEPWRPPAKERKPPALSPDASPVADASQSPSSPDIEPLPAPLPLPSAPTAAP